MSECMTVNHKIIHPKKIDESLEPIYSIVNISSKHFCVCVCVCVLSVIEVDHDIDTETLSNSFKKYAKMIPEDASSSFIHRISL